MMKKNKLLMIALSIFLLFGVVSCGTKTGEVSYNNYTSIVVPASGVDIANVSSTNQVIVLLGDATDDSQYNYSTGTGSLEWTSSDYDVKVYFVDFDAVNKTQTGLYQSIYKTPIVENGGVWDWIILQLGSFTFHASNLFGLLGDSYYYWIGLLIMTLVVRTAAWPVYAKSNDMTLKMQLAQPELDKLNEKYEGRTDQASQQRKQMEMMDIYKRYKINFAGCLMPLLQMPIFIAMYQVVQRFPVTETSVFGGSGIDMNTVFLWTNLGNTGWLANLPLALVVVGTMYLSQKLMQVRQKKNQRRRYQSPQQQKTQNQMQIFMYGMIVMMGSIALQNAGIAFYWIIGNTYQLFQSYISHRQSDKRQEELRKQF
ncbi:MAG: YidC/Oxa1 family membrane protein insertase [Candidatus Izemoplasmatales bacterium]